MPILWKYLLKTYFQVLFLCVFAFIAVLLVIRFQPIALFASSGANLRSVGLFTLYQIPYILPIALPISSLISAMVLFQRMSQSLELTALRACGIALKPIIYPLLFAAFFLSLINFTIASELTPLTRIRAKNLIYEVVEENPLIVMQKDSLVNIKSAYFDIKHLKLEKKAKEILCILKQPSNERLGLFTAKEISIHEDRIEGKSLSIISGAESHLGGHDHLIIENQKSMQTQKEELTTHLLNTDWFAKDDLLQLADIVRKLKQESSVFNKLTLEILRRVCLGLCPISFTLIGIAFGTNISRRKKKNAILTAFGLASFIMICFIATKTLQKSPFIAFSLYLLPQPIAILISLRSLSLSAKGVE